MLFHCLVFDLDLTYNKEIDKIFNIIEKFSLLLSFKNLAQELDRSFA
jgi:hypothetical protein